MCISKMHFWGADLKGRLGLANIFRHPITKIENLSITNVGPFHELGDVLGF